ncbi:paraplegin [Sitodiplosis mosellana]|uniref:paraplegin n=1 Tax=Sitodiplosis mosellana TaxID=263140 RepID=UPI0024439ACB|nr:paraplegin [Sitodiplosis mosellana]
MWSMRKPNCLFNSRHLRYALQQTSTNRTSPSVNFGTSVRIAQSPKQVKAAKDEFSAVFKLLNRSSINSIPSHFIARNLSTSTCLFEKQKETDQDTPQKSSGDENKSSDPDNKQSSGNDDDKRKKSKKSIEDKDRENNTNKMIAYLTKTILWLSLIYSISFTIFVVTSIIAGDRGGGGDSENYTISWKEFVQYMLAAGEVKEIIVRPQYEYVRIVLHDGAVINGRRPRFNSYMLTVPSVERFEQRIREVEKSMGIAEGVSIRYERFSELYMKLFAGAIACAVIYAILKRMPSASSMGRDNFFRMGKAKVTIINPSSGGKGVYFKDVAGMQEAKQEVMEFVDYLKRPQKYQALGARVPKGALLLGPPGCGKTLLAKAVATEAKVPFLTMNGSEFIEMIGGLGAARVRDLFKRAKSKAPCIIYIDEIDAIGRQRSNTTSPTSGESEQTLNQLLVEMDGMASKEGILMLASTNRADILDKALLRPGRFDRHITIDLPTLAERKEIFEKHLSGITLEKDPSTYSHRLAVLTPGFSGADIANVCNEAALHAARFCKKFVAEGDLEYAVERSVGGTEKRSNSLSKLERRTVAYHESGHALVGWLLEHSDVLQKVTIVPRTNLALGFAQYTPQDQKLFTREQLIDKICMALGGRAAENITFNRITTGAQNDLDKVTKMAFAMVAKYGMSKTIGPMYVPDEPEQSYNDEKPYSKALGDLIDIESRQIIQNAYFRAEEILKTNRDKLVTLAEALLKQETLNYDQVVELIGPPKYDAAKRKVEPIEFEQSLENLSQTETQSPSPTTTQQ